MGNGNAMLEVYSSCDMQSHDYEATLGSILALPPAGIVRFGGVLRILSCEVVAAEAPGHPNHTNRGLTVGMYELL